MISCTRFGSKNIHHPYFITIYYNISSKQAQSIQFIIAFCRKRNMIQFKILVFWFNANLQQIELIKLLAPMEQNVQVQPQLEQLQQNIQNLSDQSFAEVEIEVEEQSQEDVIETVKRRRGNKKTTDKIQCLDDQQDIQSENSEDIYDDNFIIDKLPTDRAKLISMLGQVKSKIKQYKQVFLQQDHQINRKSYVGQNSVPICADITKFDFQNLIKKQLQVAQRQFDVLMMDPPWRLSTSQPSRGVAIQYSSLGDQAIEQIPVTMLQKEGFIFIWVINAKFQWTVNVMEKKWGYKVVDSINWVKKTVNGKIAKGHGFYLQHAKQTCLVGFKGDFKNYNKGVASDVIFSFRRGQSQKPTEIYQFIEKLVPNGYYLQIFGRRNNLRSNWVTIGNEL